MKRHNFSGQGASHGTHKIHRGPGSSGPCAFPGRVFKGLRMAGHMGAEQVTTLNLEVVAGRRSSATCCSSRARSPGPKGGVVLIRDAVKGPKKGGRDGHRAPQPLPAKRSRLGRARRQRSAPQPNVPVMPQVVTAQLAARRAGTQSTKTRAEVSGGGAKPFSRRAPAKPAGLQPCAELASVAAWPSARSPASTPRRPPRRWSARPAPRPCATGPPRARSSWSRPGAGIRPAPSVPLSRPSRPSGAPSTALVVLDLDRRHAVLIFRNLPRCHVITPGELNAYDVLVQRHVVFTQGHPAPRRCASQRGGGPVKDPRDIISAPSCPRRATRSSRQNVVHVRTSTPTPPSPRSADAIEAIFSVKVAQGEHAEPQGQDASATAAPARPPPARPQAAIVTLAEGDSIDLFKRGDRTWPSASASPPAPAVGSRRSRTSPRSPRTTPEKSLLAPNTTPVVATPRAARPLVTRAAATSGSTAWSTSVAPRTACRPRWPPSSTTPTATAASRCSTTSTARRRYILRPAT